jgi:hypothetical protein
MREMERVGWLERWERGKVWLTVLSGFYYMYVK